MRLDELKKAINTKAIEFDVAMSMEKSHKELLKLYKDLKELQFQLVQAQHKLQPAE